MSTITITPEVNDLKARLKDTWMAGDYDRFSRYMEQGAVFSTNNSMFRLDVSCSTWLASGQVALWAARDGVQVTGVDIAPSLVQRAQGRADAESLKARFIEGDAEALPFEDASFDVVTSLVGAMFAPRPELVARELLRVCSPGGTIAIGNWTREGFIGQMFKTFAKFIAPSGMPAPVLWGDEAVVRERLGYGVSDLNIAKTGRFSELRARSTSKSWNRHRIGSPLAGHWRIERASQDQGSLDRHLVNQTTELNQPST